MLLAKAGGSFLFEKLGMIAGLIPCMGGPGGEGIRTPGPDHRALSHEDDG